MTQLLSLPLLMPEIRSEYWRACFCLRLAQLYALHPVSCLYRGLQQQLLLSRRKSAWGFQNPAAGAVAAHSRGPAANRHSRKVSSEPLYGVSAVVSKADGEKQTGQSIEGLAPWQRGGLEGDFTLYTDAELQQEQQQEQDGSKGIPRSGDLLGSGEYVEVLRGIFDSSSMQQRATQTRLTQLPRESVRRCGAAPVIAVAAAAYCCSFQLQHHIGSFLQFEWRTCDHELQFLN